MKTHVEWFITFTIVFAIDFLMRSVDFDSPHEAMLTLVREVVRLGWTMSLIASVRP